MRAHFPLAFALLLSACSGAATAATATAPAPPAAGLTSYPPSECTAVFSAESEATSSLVDPITEEDWQRGPADAQFTIVEYGDFQCPSCAQLAPVLAELEARYPDDLRVVYRHFPLIGSEEQPIHAKAALAMQAAEAAGLQDRYWEMHDALFASQNEWTSLSMEDFGAWLLTTAESLELDLDQFAADLHSEELAAAAQAAWAHGQEIGLKGTPYLYINGKVYWQLPLDIYSLDSFIQQTLLPERQFPECPPMALQPGTGYTATLHTEKGDIVIELYPQVAPNAVNSFIFLAERDWFDNVTFHRVIPGFVAQGGDPTGTGSGHPGYLFAIEVDPDLVFDRSGLFAMANSGPTSNGSQFFITYAAAPRLNGQYTIFGEVIAGMDVAESLTPRDTAQNAGLPPGDLILDVTIETH
jgi:cyclophilin family peptidyl-prolyl cis-trans isomerase/protein-disulfide isomerase